MSESQENIEAKLIAYVEGDLDLAARAEIEQHLKSNPTHRKLLEELKRTRDFVRALPHAKAPPELVETLQGQLERSALLDNIGVDATGSLQMRSSRLPQILSIAAVVLLAAGLGTVVYIALPRGDDRSTVARSHLDETPASAPVALSTRPAVPSVTTITIVPPEATLADATKTEAAPGTPGDLTPSVVPPAATETLTAAPTTGPAPVARDAVTMAKQVTDPHAIAADGAPKPGETLAPEPALAAPSATNTPAEAKESPLANAALQAPENALFFVVNSSNPSAVNARVTTYLRHSQIDYEENVAPNADIAANAEAPLGKDINLSTLPTQDQRLELNQQALTNAAARQAQNSYNTYGDANHQQQLQRNAALQQLALGNEAQQGRVAQQFIARRMTRQQVSELKSALDEQDVQLIEPPAAPDTLQPGDEVDVTVNELVGPGVEKTNRARVNDEGTIIMPMIEPVRAAGLTPAALSEAVARRYRDASLIPQPTVNVARVFAAAPTTLPSTTMPALDGSAATTRPAAIAEAGAAPTTAPAAAAEEAPIDVVILVQTTADVAATSQPATQPATVPATLPATLPVQTAEPDTTQPAPQPEEAAPSTLPAEPATLPAVLPMP